MKLVSAIFLATVVSLFGFPLSAQELATAAPVVDPATNDQVCLAGSSIAVAVATTVVTIASVLANLVSSEGAFGKVIHFLAINLTTKKKT